MAIEKVRHENVMIYRTKRGSKESATVDDVTEQLRKDFGANFGTITVVPNPMHNHYSALLAVEIR